MRLALLVFSLLFLATATAAADASLDIQRSLYIERSSNGGVALEPAVTLRSGDKVVLVMQWDGEEAPPFTLVSKVPEKLSFHNSASDGTEVSVDGGRRWGRLGRLRIANRMATPEDVTNVRWRIAGRGDGAVRSYKAVVR